MAHTATARVSAAGLAVGVAILAGVCISDATCESPTFTAGRKTWWAKRITASVYTTGRLTDRQIKQVSEDGFTSLLSLFPYTSTEEVYGETYPDTAATADLAQVCGLHYQTLLDDWDWKHLDTYHRYVDAYNTLPHPLVFSCATTHSSSFLAGVHAAHLYKEGLPQEQQTQYTGQLHFYKHADIHGHDYSGDQVLRELAAEILDEPLLCNPRRPDISIPVWYGSYWPVIPVYKHYYIAGQIHTSHVKKIESLGFDTIINQRKGVTSGSEQPTQEEVTLLNIRDKTGTYNNGGRQTTENLEANRLDPDLPTSYISPTSPVNYEAQNELEYGDSIGYNETTERLHVAQQHGFFYHHTPIVNGAAYSTQLWDAHKDTWLSVAQDGPAVLHCRTGIRAVTPALLSVAVTYNKSLQWMLERADIMGFTVSDAMVTMWSDVLSLHSNNNDTMQHDDDLLYLQDDPMCSGGAGGAGGAGGGGVVVTVARYSACVTALLIAWIHRCIL